METNVFNPAEHLKQFKAKMNKDSVIEWFESKEGAIAFFQLQVNNYKAEHKELTKRIGKGQGVIDTAVYKMTINNKRMADVVARFQDEMLIVLEAQIKLNEDKIEHLKTLK
jgi:hypothetical protein